MRRSYIVVLGLIMCMCFTIPAMAAPNVILDGQHLEFEVPPVIENGSTLVPLRAIFEAMGASVSWDDSTQTATAIKCNTTVIIQIGSQYPTVNGETQPQLVPAKIVNGRTMAPLRFVSEAFGGTVQWDQFTQTITIMSMPISGTPPPGQNTNLTKVHFIDVGQADSIYIQLPDHNDILIDGGNVADGSTVVNYLKSQGVDDIDLMIATHPHEDHIGGLSAVLKAYKVEQILDSGNIEDTACYKIYAADAKAEGCPWIEDNRQSFTFGKATLLILTANQEFKKTNDYSVISRLDCGNIEFLFEGDAEKDAEFSLPMEIESEILKVGHHGSASSTADAILPLIHPQVAVISVGAENTYGHPAWETLDKLKSVNVTIYRTDLNGNVIVSTDGNQYSVNLQKTPPAPAVGPYDLLPTPTPIPSSSPAPAISTGSYLGSTNSDKYHVPWCTYAQQIEGDNQVWFSNKREAESAGYVPCAVCKP